MTTPKLARSVATAFAVACVLSALSSAAPSVKGGQQSSGDQSQVGRLQSSYGDTEAEDPYQNLGEIGPGGATQEFQDTADKVDYESNRVDQPEGGSAYYPETAPGLGNKDNKGYGDDDSDDDSTWGDRWNALSSWGSNVALNVASGAHELGKGVANTATGLWNKVDDTATGLWNTVDDTFDSVWAHFKTALQSLGSTVQQGASYCAHVLQQKADDVRTSEFLQKLEDKVEQGNDRVLEFFQVLGQKINRWSEVHPDQDSVDDGLDSDSESFQQGAASFEQFEREGFPDLFQDTQVQGEIEKLVEYGIIEQEEADLFVQQRRQ